MHKNAYLSYKLLFLEKYLIRDPFYNKIIFQVHIWNWLNTLSNDINDLGEIKNMNVFGCIYVQKRLDNLHLKF